jgi:hypothetical protein
MNKKIEYYMSDSPESKAAFALEWPPVEARLRKILPLLDLNGKPVQADTWVVNVDFSKVAQALNDAPDTTGMVERFLNEVRKKAPRMMVQDLLRRPAAEITRWRKMGNKVTLLPNALILHMNELK